MGNVDSKKTIVIDLDGCLTDGKQYITSDGSKLFKAFHSRDVAAIRELIFNGWRVVIVTADNDDSGRHFAFKVGAEFLHLRDKSKIPFEYLVAVGDDSWDVPMLMKAFLPLCPPDAAGVILAYCRAKGKVLERMGGTGIMGEVLEHCNKQITEVLV
jgi:3-deoxy-D-manno-octulosonate 8-phosphate phosphatase KdsC-like HAD superfamily phosphatase